MHKHGLLPALIALLAGSACKMESGVPVASVPGNGALPLLFGGGASGHELLLSPTTWYCVSPWDPGIEPERRGMELFAWRLFVAINWPGQLTDNKKWKAGTTLAELNTSKTYPRWNSWYTPKQLHDELKGKQVEAGERTGWACDGDCLKLTLDQKLPDGNTGGTRDESHGAVYDQDGHPVRYEVRVDESFRATIKATIERPTPQKAIDFKHGQCRHRGPNNGDTYHELGATELKMAWKTLTKVEMQEGRFLQRRASVRDPRGGAQSSEVVLGLVGFHIMQKSNNYSKWIWSTFEHVDNLASTTSARMPSFYDPHCDASTCRPNTSQREPDRGSCRTQITRIDPIPREVQQLNAEVQRWLAANNTVLRYYQLVGVQYKPFAGEAALPPTLRNSVIETYLTGSTAPLGGASRPMCGEGPSSKTSSCLGCHASAQDFSFVPRRSLCNCEDRSSWIGEEACEKLGITCK